MVFGEGALRGPCSRGLEGILGWSPDLFAAGAEPQSPGPLQRMEWTFQGQRH